MAFIIGRRGYRGGSGLEGGNPGREEIGLLVALGLSEAEAELYMSAFMRPDGLPIEKVLDSHSEDIQDAIKGLVDKGAVRVVSNRLQVEDPSRFISRLVEGKRSECEAIFADYSNKARELHRRLDPLFWEIRMGIRAEEIVVPLGDLSEMELRTAKMMAGSKESISIFAETFGWYEKVREELLKALERKVRARILMLAPDNGSRRRANELRSFGAEVRLLRESGYPLRGTLVDGSELVFLIWARKREGEKPIYYKPHYTRNAGLIRIFSDAFEKRWGEAEPL
jgi:sugar-specific transcriptional regulator TrmB